jgi:hypothetical protein
MNIRERIKWKTITQCFFSTRLKLSTFIRVFFRVSRMKGNDSDRHMRTMFVEFRVLNKSVYIWSVMVSDTTGRFILQFLLRDEIGGIAVRSLMRRPKFRFSSVIYSDYFVVFVSSSSQKLLACLKTLAIIPLITSLFTMIIWIYTFEKRR